MSFQRQLRSHTRSTATAEQSNGNADTNDNSNSGNIQEIPANNPFSPMSRVRGGGGRGRPRRGRGVNQQEVAHHTHNSTVETVHEHHPAADIINSSNNGETCVNAHIQEQTARLGDEPHQFAAVPASTRGPSPLTPG